MMKLRIAALVVGMSLGVAPCAHAASIDAIYSFGDSLSDVGNVFALTGVPAPPYVNGAFSNGPLWVQDLAVGLGLAPITPSLLGGTDYAYATGETGNASFDTSNPLTDLLGPTGQLTQFQATHATADPNALYTIWIGSNDLADIPGGATPAQIGADIGTIAANIDTAISFLAGEGAKNFLIVTVPDLGKTPDAIAGGPIDVAGASALSAAFDTTLVNGAGPIPSLATLATVDGLNLNVLDAYSLVDGIVAHPANFGFTNVTSPCLVGITVCATPNQYLFWDGEHPTAAGQNLVAQDARALVVPTPEPTSISLLGMGMVGLVWLRRRATA